MTPDTPHVCECEHETSGYVRYTERGALLERQCIKCGTAMPSRIQLKRTKGWRLPPNTVKVDRSTRWGNPFRVGEEGVADAANAVRLFEALMRRCSNELNANDRYFVFTPARLRADLGGKNLACWCGPYQACHADILLKIANEETHERG